MRLYAWRGAQRNFGDELNMLLWPRLLPGILNDTGPDLLLGIGSVLDARHPRDTHKFVAGAGYGGYQPCATLDGSWRIYWVRGPLTARQLGLPSTLGLGDPASLLPMVHLPPRPAAPRAIGFMPHFESLSDGLWAEAAAAAGLLLIDPRTDPETICAAIAGCRLVLSEALHGVIVADTLRVPWVPLRPVAAVHRMKWQDWAAALGVTLRFQQLPDQPRAAIPRAFTRLAGGLGPSLAYVDQAAASLRDATGAAPQLSAEMALDRSQTRMLTRLDTLRRDLLRTRP